MRVRINKGFWEVAFELNSLIFDDLLWEGEFEIYRNLEIKKKIT